MSLGDLPASELARLDSVCLQYESDLRAGESPSIDDVVERHGGQHAVALREELQAIHEEVQAAKKRDPSSETTSGFHAGPFPGESTLNNRIELPAAGETIGPYTVGQEIGRGGMGVVYKAVDPRLDREVAIKMLAVEASKRRALAERFQREAKAVAALSHPNIVELFDIGVPERIALRGDGILGWRSSGPAIRTRADGGRRSSTPGGSNCGCLGHGSCRRGDSSRLETAQHHAGPTYGRRRGSSIIRRKRQWRRAGLE